MSSSAAAVLCVAFGVAAWSQDLPGHVYDKLVRLNVEIRGGDKPVHGFGLIAGAGKDLLVILTAAHVVGLPGNTDVVAVTASRLFDSAKYRCWVLRSETDLPSDPDHPPDRLETDDLGILGCKPESGALPSLGSFDILAHPDEARRGRRIVSLLVPQEAAEPELGTRWPVAESRGIVGRVNRSDSSIPASIDILGTFGFDPVGLSGSPVFSENGYVVAIQSSKRELLRRVFLIDGFARIYRDLDFCGELLKRAPEIGACEKPPFQSRSVSSSIPAIRPGETEFAAGVARFQFGSSLSALAPQIRLARPIPNLRGLLFTFGFEFTETAKAAADGETQASVASPSFGVQYEFLDRIPVLRSSRWLAGPYAGGGFGWAWMETGAFPSEHEPTVRSWTSYWEAGARLRITGRSYGLNGAFRHTRLIGQPQERILRFPDYSSLSIGAFWSLR